MLISQQGVNKLVLQHVAGTTPVPDTDISEENCSCAHLRGLDGRDGQEGPLGPQGPAGRDGRDGLTGPPSSWTDLK